MGRTTLLVVGDLFLSSRSSWQGAYGQEEIAFARGVELASGQPGGLRTHPHRPGSPGFVASEGRRSCSSCSESFGLAIEADEASDPQVSAIRRPWVQPTQSGGLVRRQWSWPAAKGAGLETISFHWMVHLLPTVDQSWQAVGDRNLPVQTVGPGNKLEARQRQTITAPQSLLSVALAGPAVIWGCTRIRAAPSRKTSKSAAARNTPRSVPRPSTSASTEAWLAGRLIQLPRLSMPA